MATRMRISTRRGRSDSHRSDWRRHPVLLDCLEILPTLGRVDAVVTDPPYGIGRDGHAKSKKANGQNWYKEYEFKGWDDCPPSADLLTALRSASKDQIFWGGNYFDLPASRGWLVWYKGR
jgi:site-specific DNA-methyltransferase (adenine-specific)